MIGCSEVQEQGPHVLSIKAAVRGPGIAEFAQSLCNMRNKWVEEEEAVREVGRSSVSGQWKVRIASDNQGAKERPMSVSSDARRGLRNSPGMEPWLPSRSEVTGAKAISI